MRIQSSSVRVWSAASLTVSQRSPNLALTNVAASGRLQDVIARARELIEKD
jgi:hypothetical protein